MSISPRPIVIRSHKLFALTSFQSGSGTMASKVTRPHTLSGFVAGFQVPCSWSG